MFEISSSLFGWLVDWLCLGASAHVGDAGSGRNIAFPTERSFAPIKSSSLIINHIIIKETQKFVKEIRARIQPSQAGLFFCLLNIIFINNNHGWQLPAKSSSWFVNKRFILNFIEKLSKNCFVKSQYYILIVVNTNQNYHDFPKIKPLFSPASLPLFDPSRLDSWLVKSH